jgi:hypothetical protein
MATAATAASPRVRERAIRIWPALGAGLAVVLALSLVASGAARAADTPSKQKPTKLWSAFPLGKQRPATTESPAPPATTEPATPPRRDPEPAATEAMQPPVAETDDGNSPTLFLLVAALAGATLVSVAVVGRRARAPAAPAQLAAIPRGGARSMTRFNRKHGEHGAAKGEGEERNVVRLADKMSSYTVDEKSAEGEPSGEAVAEHTAEDAVAEDAPATEPDAPESDVPQVPSTAPTTYAELGSHVSAMLAVTEETARKIVADAKAEADSVKADADAYAEKRRRDAHANASRITAKAADEARSLEQAGEETRSRIDEETERHRQLVLMSQMIEESLRQTIAAGRETLDQLDSMVDELSREGEGWAEQAQVERASA